MTPLLELRDVWKSYPSGEGTLTVLRGVDLSVEEGEWVGILGPSGSGKSTLLHIAAGLDLPDRGEVQLAGRTLTHLSRTDRAKLRREVLGFVFQFHHLMPDLSALDNVVLPLLLQGMPLTRAREEARKMLTRLGLGERLSHLPERLSGGEQQRVALARAVVHRPPLLLADEPTGNLDAENARHFLELLREFRNETPLTVVMVTHNLEHRTYFDRAFFLREGRLVPAGLEDAPAIP